MCSSDLAFELRLELPELSCEVSFTRKLRGPRDELKLTSRLIERERAPKSHPSPVLEGGLGSPHVRTEHDPSKLRRLLFVVQGEIDVALLRTPYVGELTFDQHAPPVVLEGRPNRTVDFTDAEYTLFTIVIVLFEALEERHLRHAQNLAAIHNSTKGSCSFLSEVPR